MAQYFAEVIWVRGGQLAMTAVTLRPRVDFSDNRQPTREELEAMHCQAHEACFIANSVRTEVRCEPVPTA